VFHRQQVCASGDAGAAPIPGSRNVAGDDVDLFDLAAEAFGCPGLELEAFGGDYPGEHFVRGWDQRGIGPGEHVADGAR